MKTVSQKKIDEITLNRDKMTNIYQKVKKFNLDEEEVLTIQGKKLKLADFFDDMQKKMKLLHDARANYKKHMSLFDKLNNISEKYKEQSIISLTYLIQANRYGLSKSPLTFPTIISQ